MIEHEITYINGANVEIVGSARSKRREPVSHGYPKPPNPMFRGIAFTSPMGRDTMHVATDILSFDEGDDLSVSIDGPRGAIKSNFYLNETDARALHEFLSDFFAELGTLREHASYRAKLEQQVADYNEQVTGRRT